MGQAERILAIHFAAVSLMAAVWPLGPAARRYVLLLSAAGFAAAWLARHAPRRIRHPLSLALLVVVYKQMGGFAPEVHHYQLENILVEWDRWFLDVLAVRRLVEAAGPASALALETSYLLVYVTPVAGLFVADIKGDGRTTSGYLTQVVSAVCLACFLFPFFPSEPPRLVFPQADFPAYTSWVRRAALTLVDTHGIHTSVFPSAHVALAFATAFGVWDAERPRRWVAVLFFVYAGAVTLATVYGRYHYLADGLAGFAIAWLVNRLVRRQAATQMWNSRMSRSSTT